MRLTITELTVAVAGVLFAGDVGPQQVLELAPPASVENRQPATDWPGFPFS
jgi:hypothetical protein